MKRKSLRTLLSESSIVAPGAYDAVSAKIIESLDFPAIYLTGYGASASRLGLPDYGFITQTEMVAQVSGISKAVNIPLIADADTGYGGIVNIVRTVHEFEDAQASAIQLEDQDQASKRCGHMQGKQVVERQEFINKITAAVEARRDP
ncbi:MAG: oxaloacetate decarboxylase, partial [Xenococcus sp. (in: cyanobacteria)]